MYIICHSLSALSVLYTWLSTAWLLCALGCSSQYLSCSVFFDTINLCYSSNLEKIWPLLLFFFLIICLFFYFILTVLGLLCCVGSSLVAAIGGYFSLLCAGFSLRRLFLLWSMGSVVVAYGLSCSTACGIFLDQGSNLCLLHWQQILYHPATREARHYFLKQSFASFSLLYF